MIYFLAGLIIGAFAGDYFATHYKLTSFSDTLARIEKAVKDRL